jgi:hypothetical protein
MTTGISAGSDRDGDGLYDCDDVAQGTDPAEADTDSDGFKDRPEDDFDGVNADPNEDNCPLVFNPDQVNSDAPARPNGAQISGLANPV